MGRRRKRERGLLQVLEEYDGRNVKTQPEILETFFEYIVGGQRTTTWVEEVNSDTGKVRTAVEVIHNKASPGNRNKQPQESPGETA